MLPPRRLAKYIPAPSTVREAWNARWREDDYRLALAAANEAGNREDAERLRWERRADEQFEYESREIAFTAQLLGEAYRLRVLVPARPALGEADDFWSTSQMLGERYLTARGVQEVRTGIRAEKKARREEVTALLSTVIGILGALTGLVAVVLNHKK